MTVYSNTRKRHARADSNRWLAGFCLFLGALLVVALIMVCRNWLVSQPVVTVSITGNFNHSDKGALRELIQPHLDDGMLGLDVSALRHSLEAESWIDSVELRKQWPATVYVHITEQIPVAYWQQKGFVNYRGEIFFPPTVTAAMDLPRLFGSTDQGEAIFDIYQHLNALLQHRGMAVKTLHKSDLGIYQVALSNGVNLVFDEQQRTVQLRKLAVVYDQYLIDVADRIEKIDLRYNNGLAVAWRQPDLTLNQSLMSGVLYES